MSYMQNSRLFYIDSHQRLTGDHNSFSYQIELPKKPFDRVCLMSASIPKSFYLVDGNNNKFTLVEGKINTTITVPVGNYSQTSFRTVLAALLTSSSPNSWVYTMSFPNATTSASTGKYTYTVSGNTSNPSFVFTTQTIYEQMGFEPSSTNNFSSSTITSVNVIKMRNLDSVFIYSNIASNGKDSILQEINASYTPDFGSINYTTPDVLGYSKELTTNTSNVFHFDICDHEGTLLQLNGLNVTLTVLVYQSDPIYSIIKSFINIYLSAPV